MFFFLFYEVDQFDFWEAYILKIYYTIVSSKKYKRKYKILIIFRRYAAYLYIWVKLR